MRHAYVALIAHSSAPQIYAQKQAGHQRASTTEEIYNYVFREDTRDRVGREMVKVLARAQRTLDGNGKTPRRHRRGQDRARAARRAR
jgi:integrase